MRPKDLFSYCPQCGAALEADRANPFRCRTCGLTYYFNTASAVAVFIEDPEGRCLFIRRARQPAQGMLALAGGFTDAGETGEEATRREIREELGLELGPLTYVGTWPNQYPAGLVVVDVLDLFFRAGVESPSLRLAADEVSAIEWRDPETVAPDELAFPSMRLALAAYLGQRRQAGS